jgi:hypothetical protein
MVGIAKTFLRIKLSGNILISLLVTGTGTFKVRCYFYLKNVSAFTSLFIRMIVEKELVIIYFSYCGEFGTFAHSLVMTK